MLFGILATKVAFDKLYKQAAQMKENAQIVHLVYQMIDIMHKAEESYLATVPAKNMGIHPQNRGGKKMVAFKMQTKGKKVYCVGFNLKLCGPDRAIAFEENPHTSHCQQHTAKVCENNLYFAKPHAVRGGSVGCSHLNQFIAAVDAEVKTFFPEKLSEQGSDTISKTLVSKKNDDMTNTLEKGLTWTMIKWQVEEAYPQLPDIIQRALNVEHHIGEGLGSISE